MARLDICFGIRAERSQVPMALSRYVVHMQRGPVVERPRAEHGGHMELAGEATGNDQAGQPAIQDRHFNDAREMGRQ